MQGTSFSNKTLIGTPHTSTWARHWKYHITLLVICVWAVIMRLIDIGRPFLGDFAWNEVYYTYIARSFLQGAGLLQQQDLNTGTAVFSTPLIPWMIYGSFRLFGYHEWSARIPMLVFGIIAILLLYKMTLILYGQIPALVTTFIVATAPGVVFFSRNIQLDGVMTTFGLGAIVSMLLYRERGRVGWLVISSLLCALAIFAKYTAVLFWPALAVAFLQGLKPWHTRYHLGVLAFYMLIALAPALGWIALSFLHPELMVSSATTNSQALVAGTSYFSRFNEWHISIFGQALVSLWFKTMSHLGSAIWYAILFIALLSGFNSTQHASIGTFVRTYALPIAITLPWYLQIGYPNSWILNEYYDYPSLFGIAILLGVAGVTVWKHLTLWLCISGRRGIALIVCLFGLISVSNILDYRSSFHSSYTPWGVVSPHDPLESAQRIAELNVDNDPVLTDLPFTFYYTKADRRNSRFIWWGGWDGSATKIIMAIRSGGFPFVAFTYPPTVAIDEALRTCGYERVAPAAWHLTGGTHICHSEDS